jgi:RND family efflux transporter MFP subunit
MKRFNHSAKTFFICLTLLFSACNKGNEHANLSKEEENLPDDIVELRADQQKLAGIETGTIALMEMGSSLKVNGIVAFAPQNLASVSSPVGGFIKQVSLVPGSAVKKGQLLAVIASQEFIDMQENYLEVRSRLEFAESEYNRHSELYKEDVYSQQNVQQVTADYKSLKAKVKAFEQKLKLIGIDPLSLNEDGISNAFNIVAPITGHIKSAAINLGKSVTPADVLFEIVNSDALYLELTLFEKDAIRVFSGQKIRFFLNNESEAHEAEVYQTGRSVGDDKSFRVYARVLSACKNVWPGMYVNALIETSGSRVPAVPDEAVVNFEDRDYIFVFEKEKEEEGKPFTEYRMIPVQKGASANGNTELILPEGFDLTTSKVVVKGAYNLLSAKKNAGEMAC